MEKKIPAIQLTTLVHPQQNTGAHRLITSWMHIANPCICKSLEQMHGPLAPGLEVHT